MDTIFINSENSRTSEYHVLVLKLTDKLDLRRDEVKSDQTSKPLGVGDKINLTLIIK